MEQIDKMSSTNMKTESCIEAAWCQRAKRRIGLLDIKRVTGNKLAVQISEGKADLNKHTQISSNKQAYSPSLAASQTPMLQSNFVGHWPFSPGEIFRFPLPHLPHKTEL